MVNFGGAPHDSDDIQDLWYALKEAGFTDATGENPSISIDDSGNSITIDTDGTELDLVIQDIVDALEQANNVSVNVDNQPISIDDDGATLTVDTDSGPIDISVTGQPISIDDNGSSLTIDTSAGPIDVNQSGSVSINEPLTVDSPNSENFENHPHGRQPDGDLLGDKAKGEAFRTSDQLNAGETFTSDWYDTDGFESIEIFIRSDVESKVDGIEVQYTEDAQATTPSVDAKKFRTFGSQDTERGFKTANFDTTLDGFRLKYENNSNATSNLFIVGTLSTSVALSGADYVGENFLGDNVVNVGNNPNAQGLKIGGPSSLFGDLVTIERTTVIDLASTFGTSTLRDNITSTGSGAVDQDPDPTTGEITLRTGTTADSSVDLRTVEYGRYTPGFSGQMGVGIRIPTKPTEGEARWGYFSDSDGFYWGYDGSADELFIARQKDGNEVERVFQSDFNRNAVEDVIDRPWDITQGNIFQIDFSWYGYGVIQFSLVTNTRDNPLLTETPGQTTTVVHTISIRDETSVVDPNQPISVEVENGSSGENIEVRLGGRQFSVFGQPPKEERITADTVAEETVAQGSWTHLMSWRRDVSELSSSKLNISGLDFSVNQVSKVALVVNANLSGTSFGDPTLIDTNETLLEVSTAGTFDGIGNGTKIWEGSINPGGTGRGSVDNFSADVDVRFGQSITLSLVAQAIGNSGDATATMRLEEDW